MKAFDEWWDRQEKEYIRKNPPQIGQEALFMRDCLLHNKLIARGTWKAALEWVFYEAGCRSGNKTKEDWAKHLEIDIIKELEND